MYWIIADTHFGHDKMIELCGRPKGFEQKIIDNLYKMVKVGDTLIHLGDVCIGNDRMWNTKLTSTMRYAKKCLVRGNHDKKSNSWYLDTGWDFICDSFVMIKFGKRLLFSHAPEAGQFDINIHGHIHGGDPARHDHELGITRSSKHVLVAVEHAYKPVGLKSLIL